MPHVEIHLEGDGCWPDLQGPKNPTGKAFLWGEVKELAYLKGGMQSGDPSISLRIETDDGRTVVAETSARMLIMMARAVRGRMEYEGIQDLP